MEWKSRLLSSPHHRRPPAAPSSVDIEKKQLCTNRSRATTRRRRHQEPVTRRSPPRHLHDSLSLSLDPTTSLQSSRNRSLGGRNGQLKEETCCSNCHKKLCYTEVSFISFTAHL
ncbi:hypothetical protein L6452_11114 [Arctium lappa]|uniref:Uncharacterized protein n=1 Tax=Arctium lappa TaxID=4217 RepID=A0ACB9DP22_ARCLA|nr:hypothetical protein L6452_11114 [Arctium lappa]